MSEKAISEIITYIISVMNKTKLKDKINNLSLNVGKIISIYEKTYQRLENKDINKILNFLKKHQILLNTIIPNISKILDDKKIDLQDTPYFLNIIHGVYLTISEYMMDKSKINISINDVIEITALIIKIVLILVISNDDYINISSLILDQSINLIKLTIKTKKCSCLSICKK
jgi:hypothetical protein